MREQHTLDEFLKADAAWTDYKESWLADLKQAKQPPPSPEQIVTVREIWLSGFLANDDAKPD